MTSAMAADWSPNQYSYAETARGKIHYHLAGPEDGFLIVLVHGIGNFSYAWEALATKLRDTGYRTLVFDLWGRGYSDNTAGLQDGTFFVDQIQMLLQHLHLEKQPHGIIGHSMGGAITCHYATAHPDNVKFMILIASAGALSMFVLKLLKALCGPLQRMLLSSAMSLDAQEKAWNRDMYEPQHNQEVYNCMKKHQMWQYENRKDNFLAAIGSSILHFPLGGDASMSMIATLGAKLKADGVPVLILWGKNDVVVPYNCSEYFTKSFPHAKLISYDRCGHSPHTEHADKAASDIVQWVAEVLVKAVPAVQEADVQPVVSE
eukprot:TRINITY_DN8187_c0_g1_i1.p1 TRINITY_DN8187_c0_g1~~TRINITY_DN8187_c0_g1_i1.p1  ORF type:complete len:318 (+),score=42.12 TRINITY_DN8187_c0_g1_i1:110-1063(+)